MVSRVLTYEAPNFIQNFFFVAQMRPDFVPKENKNDEDIFSDEEIDKSTTDIKTLLNTHVGSTRDNDEDDMDDQTTYALSVQAMQQASRMWPEESTTPDATLKKHATKRKLPKYSETELEKLKRETHRSQAQTQNFKAAADDIEASFEIKGSYSEKNLREFFARCREDTTI